MDERQRNAAQYRLEGSHWAHAGERFEFDPGELLIDGRDFEIMEIHAEFPVSAHKLTLVSKFEVAGQGRAISYEGAENVVPGAKIEVSLVHKFPVKD
jgi:hypothetical protein